MKLFCVLFFLLPIFGAIADELGENNAKIQIKVGGEIDAQVTKNNAQGVYGANILPDNSINRGNNDVSGRVKALANIEIAVKTKFFRYGGFVGLQTGKIEDDFGQYARESFIFLEHPYGKVEFGAVYSSSARMRIDATNLARATGGIQGDWFRYVPMPVYHSSDNSLIMGAAPIFILQPMLPNEAGFTTGAFNGNFAYSDAPYTPSGSMPNTVMYQNAVQPRLGWGSLSNKVSYYTKRIAGIQLGISYSPNTGLTGVLMNQESGYAKDYLGQYYNLNQTGIAGNVINLVTVGANYVKQFGDLGVAASFTYEHGEYQGSAFTSRNISYSGFPNRRDLNAIAVGGKLTYGPISVAYSYGNWLQSLSPSGGSAQASLTYYNSDGTQTTNETFFHTAGLGLTFGPINCSGTYMYSNYRGNAMHLASFGTDIKLGGLWGRGLVPYFEVTYYDLNPAFGKASSGSLLQADALKGVVIIGGIKLIF